MGPPPPHSVGRVRTSKHGRLLCGCDPFYKIPFIYNLLDLRDSVYFTHLPLSSSKGPHPRNAEHATFKPNSDLIPYDYRGLQVYLDGVCLSMIAP